MAVPSFADLFSGQNLLGTGLGGQQLTPDAQGNATPQIGGGLGANTLVGLGMGLLQPWAQGSSPWANALPAYQAGAQADALNQYRGAQLAQQQADMKQRADLQRQQMDLQRQIAFKPEIYWQKGKEDAYGNQSPDIPYLIMRDPSNPAIPSIKQISPLNAQKLSQVLPTRTDTATDTTAPPAGTAATDETAIPATAQAAQAAPQPQIPAGVNPKEYVKQYSHKLAEESAATEARQKEGSKVLGMIDRLEAKTYNADRTGNNPLFSQGVGPTYEYASSQPIWNPARLAYEYTSAGPSAEAKGFLTAVRADAAAIQSELQRIYLKGQGSVSNFERLGVNDIVGRIAAARSPEEARMLLNNLRGIAGTVLQQGYNVPGAGQPQQGAAAPAQGRKIDRAAARKAGYTDAEIDAFERGQ